MTTIKVKVARAHACATVDGYLTSGMVGVPCTFEYGPEWEGLNKTAVFTAGCVTRDVLNADETVDIPAECLEFPGVRLTVGVYGYRDDGTIVIPTIMVPVGYILPGADPSGDPGTDPELPVWAQLQLLIDELRKNGTVTDEQIARAVAEYLEKNPVETPDAVQYTEQALTEEQQMQARANLGIYRKCEEPIILHEEPHSWCDDEHLALSDEVTIDVQDMHVTIVGTASGIIFLNESLERVDYTHKWSEYSYSYYGNRYYIADIVRTVENLPNLEVEDNGIPFILYRYDTGNGMSNWLYWYDRAQFSGERIGYDLTLSDANNTQTVYYTIPEEYLPDTIVKTINGTVPDENGNVEITIPDYGQDGNDGFSPAATVTQTDTGAVITITDKDGTTTATVTNGKDGDKGDPGENYVLTDTDKEEIAEMVSNTEIVVQAPAHAATVEEMTDTSKVYIGANGNLWAYKSGMTQIQTVRENIDGLIDNSRLGSDGSTATDATAYAGYVATDYIDLLKYSIPFQLHIDGGVFLPAAADSYTRMGTYTADKTKITVLQPIRDGIDQILNVPDSDVTVDDNNNLTITFNQTPTTNNANNDGVLQYVRFSGKGEPDTVSVYITFESEVSGDGWVDTGIKYSPSLTDAEKTQIAEEAAGLIDTELLGVIGDGTVTV